ncbi:MAG: hypothetical protein QX198_14830, partial [Methylococcaceae bacterium]
ITIGGATLAWILKTLWNATERLKSDLKDLEVKLPETYAMKIDIDKRFDRIEAVLDKIWEKVDGKVDRHG